MRTDNLNPGLQRHVKAFRADLILFGCFSEQLFRLWYLLSGVPGSLRSLGIGSTPWASDYWASNTCFVDMWVFETRRMLG